jgi:transcriptional regulator with XRE-family HTH domain
MKIYNQGAYRLYYQGDRSLIRFKLKEVLADKHISMGKLSRLSDVSYSTISRIANNDASYSPTINILQRIAKALNVSISDLYYEETDQEP